MAAVAAIGLLAVTPALSAQTQPVDLQALIDEAPAGSVLELPSGVYRGGVIIDKPLTIRGSGRPVIDAGGEGTAIEIEAPDVTVERVVIRGTGRSLDRENAGISANAPRAMILDNSFEDVLFGVFLRRATDSVVARNVIGAKDLDVARRGDGIRLWESDGTQVPDNVVVGGRDLVMWFSSGLLVRGNQVRDGRYGLHFMYSDDALIENNRLEDNSVGAFLMYSRRLRLRDNVFAGNYGPSGYGVGLKDMDGVVATGNRFVSNRVGLYLDNSPWSVDQRHTFEENLFAYNEIGVLFLPSVKRNDFSRNAFVDNRQQVGVSGSGRFGGNEWTLDGVGNYWSDFAGYDADSDGLGDVSYRLEELYGALTDAHPELMLFAETPASHAANLAGRVFPVLTPEAKVVDEAPLIKLPVFESWDDAQGSSYALWAASAVLLAVAGLLAWAGLGRRGGL